jgi:hypothetical protein
MKARERSLIDPLARHGAIARQALGIKSPRDLDDETRIALETLGNPPANARPRFTGSHLDGTASREIVRVLEWHGLGVDETDDDPDPEYIAKGTGVPTITALTAAGTTAAASLVEGNDRNGLVQLTPGGAGIAAGSQLRISFANARADSSFSVHYQRTDLTAGSVDARPTGRSTAKVDLWTLAALTSGQTYNFYYVIDDD